MRLRDKRTYWWPRRTFNFTLGKFDVEVSSSALRKWNSAYFYSDLNSMKGLHLVWFIFSLKIDDWTLEHWPICAECGSPEIGEQHMGDEGWTICQNCRSTEQGYRYVNLREYEGAN